jgi:hypothetical protein
MTTRHLGIGSRRFEKKCWPHLQGLKCWRIRKNVLNISTAEDEGTTFSRKNRNWLSIDKVSYSRRRASLYNQSDCEPVQMHLWVFQCENLTSRYFDMAKIITLTPLSLIFPCTLSVQLLSFKIRTLCICADMFWQNFRVALRDLTEYLL